MACAASAFVLVGTNAQAAPTPGVSKTGSTVDGVFAHLAAVHGAHGGGLFSSAEGQQVRAALKAAGASGSGSGVVVHKAAGNGSVSPNVVPPPDPGSDCTGYFNDEPAADVYLQESWTSIPWGVYLTDANAGLGVVAFNNQTWADNREQNGYSTHVEPWDYTFHANLGNPFSVKGGGDYLMGPGASVSFYWYWNSVADPGSGGYAWVNCTYEPDVN
ncbi:hypothetical protein KGA66_16000 [Actinocrinis puniceicyclus]|uniref:Uncharacterized protein n=1 Tax=Actinocrinis puniceicyclus TaxID=977794 RepID=A0A8J7WR18_9ACTN|nr:hypothetical protein [Actinocrinis puniceicyclus]MBS2964559.1 hypothetical protein [Actinocrinis puniceicyclus]